MKFLNSLANLIFFGCLALVFLPVFATDGIFLELQSGEKFYFEKNYKECMYHYKRAIYLNNSSLKAHLGFARCSYELGLKKDAISSYSRILELEPNHNEALAGLAEILAESKKFKEAIELIDRGLKNEPYNARLLISEIKILMMMDQKILTLRKIEEAKQKIPNTLELELLHAKALAINKKYKSSEELFNRLMTEYPENGLPFYEMAKLKIEKAEKSNPETQIELMTESKGLLNTSLALNSDLDDARKLLVKVNLWFGEHQSAYDHLLELEKNTPEDKDISYLKAYLLNLQRESKQSTKLDIDSAISAYTDLLSNSQLNEMARFSAEEFALKNLPESHKFRNSLGIYRLKRYRNQLNSMNKYDADFHLLRASHLIRDNYYLKSDLLDYYYTNYRINELIQMLTRMREQDPKNLKLHSRLEKALFTKRNGLLYKEGFIQVDDEELSGLDRNSPEMFLFDPESKSFLSNHPNSSTLIRKSTQFALSMYNGIKTISGEEDESIRREIAQKKGNTNYTEAITYSPDVLNLLDIHRKKNNKIRYIGYGYYTEENESIKMEYYIYDRLTGKNVQGIKIHTSGRDYLTELSNRLAFKINKSLPKSGKIIKIKDDSIIINIGFRDGFKKNQVFKIIHNQKEVARVKLDIVDEYVSQASLIDKNWDREIALKDTAVPVYKKIKKEKKDGN